MKRYHSVDEAISELDLLSINTIRFLSIDAIQKADSGHPGLPMGAAPMAYVLWRKFLRHNPSNPNWFNRDRFILSAGHGSMLLYSLLYLTGYDLTMDQIKQFRQWGSITPGHPECGVTPGVEATTGPLGQGFANGVGMAIAEQNLAVRYNRPGFNIVDHFTYSLVSDGDLMEGVASEAASLAGHLKLGKLIYLYDNNHVTLSAATDITFTENCAARFKAYGWHVQSVENGNDLAAIEKAIRKAQLATEKPSLILIRTHIGFGSPNKQDTYEAHGAPLGVEEVKLTKQALGWPLDPTFFVSPEVNAHFRDSSIKNGRELESRWNGKFNEYTASFPELAKEFQLVVQGKLPDGWDRDLPVFPADPKGMATRIASGKTLSVLQVRLPALIGGSGDLDPSTHTTLKSLGDFESPDKTGADEQGSAGGGWEYSGRSLHFGVREHAMGAIANGLALHGGTLPFVATFLVFSDYMRPSVRLAALMKTRVTFVFTHDSIGLGEDGPTHQPVEQLASLRAIPNLVVIRPCDANETVAAWKVAIEMTNRPVVLVLSRQSLPTLDRLKFASAEGLRRGAYILSDVPDHKPDLILISTGSEVSLVVAAEELLAKQGIHARVVSMPSSRLFDEQPESYRDEILPPQIRARLAVEAASPQGWYKYVGIDGYVIGIDRFGASAPGQIVMREYGFTAEIVAERAKQLLNRKAVPA
jgi:transketolase